ncbi:MAG: acyl-CoA dehydrogenase family protein [Pseudomonadota bacterium]|nr:acyl-CoA dehydrogenase family protein [Pseudomonadota bacterium]
MDFTISPKASNILKEVKSLIHNEIIPSEAEYFNETKKQNYSQRFTITSRQVEILEELKNKAREKNLWNLWLTNSTKGQGINTVDYAYLAEEMGWSYLAPEVFNCSAPDTGNMEVLERYGSEKHKEKWLKPLLDGKIRSAYLMTEPDVSSSDATNISFRAELDGNEWVLNGEKYWASGAGDPRCKLYILMACTEDNTKPRHQRHSQFAIDPDLKGINIIRPMEVFGHDDAPHGHMHIKFENVKVPKDSLIFGRGRGFEIAQGRLGPGRIHHCMRAIGQAEYALKLLCKRAVSRTAFGQPLAKLGANKDIIAERRIAIEQARLLCLKAAWMMDNRPIKEASVWISKIKVIAPRIALETVDEAMQIYGATGISQDTPLAKMWLGLRTLRFADGPDAVHRMVIARQELKKSSNAK